MKETCPNQMVQFVYLLSAGVTAGAMEGAGRGRVHGVGKWHLRGCNSASLDDRFAHPLVDAVCCCTRLNLLQ